MRTPKIDRKIICDTCNGRKEMFAHRKSMGKFYHKFVPRQENLKEAAYRTGYENGSGEATSRAIWGSGWD